MNNQNIIEIQGVEKRFGSFTAVSNLSLTLKQGEFFSLLGPSGCGKTTALRMIAGFFEPEEGEIRIDGQLMKGIPANKRPTNMVFQSYAIFPHLNVHNNVAFGLRKSGLTNREIDQRVDEALELVELSGLGVRNADELSGGQRQRVALARALVMHPKVLLLDEPLSALDKNLRETMQIELRRLQQSIGITFVMVTHDQYEAMTMSDRIGVMFDGKLLQVDRPEILYANPCNRDVAGFIGGMNFLPAKLIKEEGGALQVEVPGFGSIRVDINQNIHAHGREMLVGVRPEQLEIGATKSQDCEISVEGVVSNVAFYGQSVEYFVDVPGLDAPITVTVPNYFHTIQHQSGDKVWIGLQQTSVIDLGSPNGENGK